MGAPMIPVPLEAVLDAGSKAGGGIVSAPTGQYRINGNLVIPGGVTLLGTYRVSPCNNTGETTSKLYGAVLLAYAGRGVLNFFVPKRQRLKIFLTGVKPNWPQ